MNAIYFTAEHSAFRKSVRDFLGEAIAPHAAAWEEARQVPASAWQDFGRLGLLGLAHETVHGGSARDIFYSVAFLEELGRLGYGGLRASISVHAYMASHYLARYANADLQQRYLRPAISGKKIAALAITEWDAGSDLSKLTTTAQPDGDLLIINGVKTYITNGSNADYFIVAVRSAAPDQQAKRANTGISLVLVDANTDGISVTPQEKLGWHGAGTAQISFENVAVPVGHLIGRANSGFQYLMHGFQLERLVAATLSIGSMEYNLETALTYLTRRRAFAGKLSDLQAIRHRIANLQTELTAARMLSYHAAWLYQQDPLSVTECSMAKLHATELACRIADECLQLQGGRGYLADSEASRMFRDARAGSLAGGTSEIMREIIAQQTIDMKRV